MEWKKKTVDTSADVTTIINVPALVKGVYINTALSAHTVVIKDGTTGDDLTIPANAAAGNYYDWEATRFEESLIVDPNDSSTGSLTVFYTDLARHD